MIIKRTSKLVKYLVIATILLSLSISLFGIDPQNLFQNINNPAKIEAQFDEVTPIGTPVILTDNKSSENMGTTGNPALPLSVPTITPQIQASSQMTEKSLNTEGIAQDNAIVGESLPSPETKNLPETSIGTSNETDSSQIVTSGGKKGRSSR